MTIRKKHANFTPMLIVDLQAFPVLTSDRLVLRQLQPSDSEQMLAMRSDPRVMEHIPRPLAKTIDDATALIELINSMVAANDAVQWAITLKGEDRFIGLIGFWRIVKEHHFAELGYMILPDHWGKGIISEAICTALEFGFGPLALHRVEAITRPQNTASIRALEKNGFVREGYFKEDIFFEGVFHDSVYFGRLAK